MEDAISVGADYPPDVRIGRGRPDLRLLFQVLSAIREVPTIVRLLPIEPPAATKAQAAATPAAKTYEFEPDAEGLLGALLPRYFLTLVWQAMLESTASEFGARMTAMTSATDNAGKMINKLTLTANRERQAAITKEILEVVGGAEALKA